jgi:penicillin G amidase
VFFCSESIKYENNITILHFDLVLLWFCKTSKVAPNYPTLTIFQPSMIKLIKFIAAAGVAAALVWALDHNFSVGGNKLPAFGKLLNPFTGVWQNTPLPVAKPFAPVANAALKGKVEVAYDERMVPHIFADSTEDAFFVQGYIHAQNRLFQMDLTTRATAGRLSEIFGSKLNKYDLEQRRIGMLYAAQNAADAWAKDLVTNAVLTSYSAGVNAYINSLDPKDYPIEYKLMGFSPEPWSALKSALIYKSMAKSLCFKDNEAEMTKLREVLGDAAMTAMFPEWYPEMEPIVPNGTPYNFTATPAKPETPALPAVLGDNSGKLNIEQPDDNLGSNNWAVAGSKTLNKAPILCSDPHLPRNLPALWYECQIKTPILNAYGVSLPGVPGLIIGFNEEIAWGITNMEHDVKDWYKIKWLDAAKTTYEFDGKPKKVTLKVEQIVNGGSIDTLLDTVRYTVWGPVPFINPADSSAYQDMALRWIAHDAGTGGELLTFMRLMSAKNYADFRKAVSTFVAPGSNFCFASVHNEIALQPSAKLPIRQKGQGRYFQDGSLSTNGWGGYIPFEQIPTIVNPARGFVFSANQHTTGPNYPYYYNGVGFDNSRSRHLFNNLVKMDSITVADMKNLQNDDFSLQASEALPAMLALVDSTVLDPASRKMYNSLKAWDFHYKADKTEPVLYSLWFDAVRTNTWDEVTAHAASDRMRLPEDGTTVHYLMKDPNNIWFDMKSTVAKETAKDVVTASFKTMVADYAKLLLTDPTLSWGSYNKAEANHIAKLDGFSRKNLMVNGTGRSLNANGNVWGPSWRMVVELSKPVKAWVVYPGGQSGDPGSKNYDDFIDTWAKSEYFEAKFLTALPVKDPAFLLTQSFTPKAK